MNESAVPDKKRMRLPYAGRCLVCSFELPKGSDAVYEDATKTVRCVLCAVPQNAPTADESAASLEPVAAIDSGVPGASTRREFERRQARREEGIRAKHKRLGGLILAVFGRPAFDPSVGHMSHRRGAVGGLGSTSLTVSLCRVLHDRKVPAAAPTSTISR